MVAVSSAALDVREFSKHIYIKHQTYIQQLTIRIRHEVSMIIILIHNTKKQGHRAIPL